MRGRRWVAVALATAVLGTAAASASLGVTGGVPPAGPPLAGIRVLITNDDSVRALDPLGREGKGLYELRKALCAAGADVLVVGPSGQQSGASARITPPLADMTVSTVTPPAAYTGDCASAPAAGQVYAVCLGTAACTPTSTTASPADTVLLALSRFVPDNFWADGPDVVFSGTNSGANVGETVNHSGTVGAAVTAHEFGVPAIAISAEIDLSLGIPNALLAAPYAQAGAFAAGLLDQLEASGQLAGSLVLNVNYPVLGSDETLGKPVLTVVGDAASIAFAYNGTVGVGGGTYSLGVGSPAAETVRDADTTALAANDIPITPLDGDYTQTRGFEGVKSVVARLAQG